MLHGIHCIQSCCMESTAFNRDAFYQAAWNPLHSLTLHGIHCIQLRCILPRCMDYTAFTPNAWNPLHLMTLHGIHCIQSGCFGPCCKTSTAFNHAAGIHVIQSCCIKDTSFNRIPLLQAAWNTLNSITLHGIQCIQ